MEIVSKNEKETFAFAKEVAGKLKKGSVLALTGDLGSGKTTFTKGLALELGVKDQITSPTFVLMKQYDLIKFDGKLSHIDCYRMESQEDAEGIGVDEIFRQNHGVTILEWADRIGSILPERTIFIRFESVGDQRKIITKGL